MTDLPNHLSPGDKLPASWLNRLVDHLKGARLNAGPGLRLTRTPSGTTVSIAPPGAADAAALGPIPARITAHRGHGVYDAAFYSRGATLGPTFYGKVYLTALAVHTMGNRTGWVLAHPVAVGAEYWATEETAEEETT